MSTPPFLDLPASTRAYALDTARGAFAVLDTRADLGQPRRTTAVLLPGFTGSKEDFVAVLGPLAAAGHRVVALDQRGQFETPGPEGPEAYTVPALAADLRAVLASVDDRPVHLVGHSFGGLVARAALLDDPGAARSCTLLSSGPAGVAGPPADRLALLAPVLREHGMEGLWRGLQALDEADGTATSPPPEVAAFLRRRFFANAPAGLLGMSDALRHEPDRVAELAATGTPLLVAHGPDDDVWPPVVQEEMARRLGARYAPVVGAVHSPAAEAPQATARVLLEFWSACETASPVAGGARA